MAKEVYTTERLGPKQAETPEGYLYCQDVPIARTGIMVYGPWELRDARNEMLEPGKDGVIYVTRDADELFNVRTMSSIEGKPITINHPDTVGQLVNAGNWRDVARGTVQNVRQGTGDQSHLLLADFLVTSKDAIDLVRSKRLREVSLGYMANYEQMTPGLAKQTEILGNHTAFVERGRCGATCAIGDSKMDVVLNHRKETLRKAFNTRDAALFARALDDFGDFGKPKEKDKEKAPPDEYDDSEPGKTETESGFENGNGGEKPAPTDAPDAGGGTHHHVTVNLHGVAGGPPAAGAAATVDPSDMSTGSPAQGGATQEGVDPNNPEVPGGDPGAGQDPVEMIMGALKKIDMRLSAVEQVVGGGQAPQPQQAAPKPPGQMGGAPPKSQQTQDAGEIVADESDDDSSSDDESDSASDDSTEGPSGSPGPELEKDMNGVEAGNDGGGGPSPENKNAPLLKTEEGSDSDNSGKDPLPKTVTGDKMYVPTQMEATRRREEWTNTLSRAELLMPGVRLPTFDAALNEKQAGDTLCNFKRKTLAASFETDKGNQAIRGFVTTDSPKFSSMTCDAVNVLFTAASERVRDRNNILNVQRGPSIGLDKATKPQTPAELNAFYRAHFEARDRGQIS